MDLVSMFPFSILKLNIFSRHLHSPPIPTATMITAFNGSFGLEENLLDLGLQVFRPIIMRNDVFYKLASLLPPLTGVTTNSKIICYDLYAYMLFGPH